MTRVAGPALVVVMLGAAIAAFLVKSRAVGGTPAPPSAVATSRDALDRSIAELRARVAADAGDADAAIRLADALMRAARVHGDASLPLEAERVLQSARAHGDAAVAGRMLAAVYLAQHRFREGLELASDALRSSPDDAWMQAVAGDALVELGRYDEAFAMFDRAAGTRPDAGVYARIAYARELQGDLEGAVPLMAMAAEATPPSDVEAQAWVLSQLGLLHLHQRQFPDAERAFRRAEFAFPGHPYPRMGRVRLAIARRQFDEALALVDTVPESPETLAVRGDLLARLGRSSEAEAAYRRAELTEREGWEQEAPQPAALARFLAERDRSIPEAVALAERAAAERADIHTLDALGWSYFKAGRLNEAAAAIGRAMRTGTRDARIQCHAEAIARAQQSGHTAEACDPLTVAG